MTPAERDRESAFDDWRTNIILGRSDVEATAHEAFCAGWEAQRERLYAELGNDHYVIFTEDHWTIEHSVECRLSGHMHECEYHTAARRAADECNPWPGRWRINGIDGDGLPSLERAGQPGEEEADA